MSGTNGYGTLGQLRAIKRLEKDYTDWPAMRIRIQALNGPELARVRDYATARVEQGKEKDGSPKYVTEYSTELDNLAAVAFGLVHPEVMIDDDLVTACNVAAMIPPGVITILAAEIYGLTYRTPSQAFRDFTDGDASPAVEADTAPSTSSSVTPSRSPTRASSTKR